MRLACERCDRKDFDGTTREAALAAGWTEIEPDEPEAESVIDWWYYLGVCPDCRSSEMNAYQPPGETLPPRVRAAVERSAEKVRPAVDAEAMRAAFHDPGAVVLPRVLISWADAALDEIARLRPFEARCRPRGQGR